MMGKKRRENDPCIATHEKHYMEYKKYNQMLIIENVSEYSVDLVKASLGAKWSMQVTRLDPRLFGLPVARARLYIIAYRHDRLRWASDLTLDDFVKICSSQCVLSARNLFWMTLSEQEISDAEAPWLQSSFNCPINDRKQKNMPMNKWCNKLIPVACHSGQKLGCVSNAQTFPVSGSDTVCQERKRTWRIEGWLSYDTDHEQWQNLL